MAGARPQRAVGAGAGETGETGVGRGRPAGSTSAQQLMKPVGYEHDDGAAVEPDGDLHDELHGSGLSTDTAFSRPPGMSSETPDDLTDRSAGRWARWW